MKNILLAARCLEENNGSLLSINVFQNIEVKIPQR